MIHIFNISVKYNQTTEKGVFDSGSNSLGAPALRFLLEVPQHGPYERTLTHTESKNIFGTEECPEERLRICLGQN